MIAFHLILLRGYVAVDPDWRDDTHPKCTVCITVNRLHVNGSPAALANNTRPHDPTIPLAVQRLT